MLDIGGHAAAVSPLDAGIEAKPLRYIIIGEPGVIDLVERVLAERAKAPGGAVLILTEDEMALWDRCVRVLT